MKKLMEQSEEIFSEKANFCFCTLALGKEYRDLASLLAEDIALYSPNTPLVVLTDRPAHFSAHRNMLAFEHRQQSVGCYQDKVYVIRKALSLFNCCIFMDADMRILAPFPIREWMPGITARSCSSIIKHFATQIKNTDGRDKKNQVVKRTAEKLELNLHDESLKFVHEFLFVVTRDEGKEMVFLQVWEQLGQYFELQGIYGGEGHTIGLAAAKVGFPIRHDEMENFNFFKDKVERIRIQKGQSDPNETISYFEIRKQISRKNSSIPYKIIKKIDRQIAFFYRWVRLRIRTLKNFNF